MLYSVEEMKGGGVLIIEERLEALECALSVMRIEQIANVRQLDERISILHQQVAEQRRRLSEREQDFQQMKQLITDTHQRVEGLTSVLTLQFRAINARFDEQEARLGTQVASINARIDEQEKQMGIRFDDQEKRIEARFDTQEKWIGARFDAQETWINMRFDAQEQRMERMEARFDAQDLRFDTLEAQFSWLERQLDHWMIEIREKFDASDHYATVTRGIVEAHELDIREVKSRLEVIGGRQEVADQKLDTIIALLTNNRTPPPLSPQQ